MAKNNDRATTNKKTSVNRRKNNDSSPLLPVEIHTLEVQNLHLNQYDIEKLIYVIRGRQVMIDSDLAMLYGEETKYLKRAVRANISRFPEDFMFTLSREEFNDLRCKNGTSNKQGGTRYLPYAFTEIGIAMLSSVLRSQTAIIYNNNHIIHV